MPASIRAVPRVGAERRDEAIGEFRSACVGHELRAVGEVTTQGDAHQASRVGLVDVVVNGWIVTKTEFAREVRDKGRAQRRKSAAHVPGVARLDDVLRDVQTILDDVPIRRDRRTRPSSC